MDYISALVGRNIAAVERMLGPADKKEPLTSSKEDRSFKAYFIEEGIEIVFIDNVADWITIHNIHGRVLQDIISFCGLVELTPSFKVQDRVSYTNLIGLNEVTFHGNGHGGIAYVNIKAFTD